MSDLFRILRDEEFKYRDRRRLFLMLLCENGRYAIEVVSEEASYGRRFFENKRQAEKAFLYMSNKLSVYTDFDFVSQLLLSCKDMTMTELSFMFLVYGKKLSQIQIGKLIEKFQLKIKSKVGADKSMTIKITFESKTKCLGEFRGTFLKKDFSFFLT